MLVKRVHTNSKINNYVEMSIQGSKHSFSRILPSFLQFNSGIVRNVPDIKDVEIQIDIMKKLGFLLDFDKNSNVLNYSGINKRKKGVVNIKDYSSRYSRSLINLYPIFSRFDIKLKEPTGCPIGRRDISWYVEIMKKFGISFDINDMYTRVYRSELKKVSEITVRDRSFSSTNIAITCAIEAKSDTKIFGPSLEPEIFDLISMLKNAGVKISHNMENDYFHIHADRFDEKKVVDHIILPDRNVIVTLVCGALLLKKDICINTFGFTETQLQLAPFLEILKQLNIEYRYKDNSLLVMGSSCNIKGMELEIKAGHYPLFCSDWQPLLAVLSVLGLNMTIEDTLFESRFGYLNEYKKFGVRFEIIDERRARILDSEGYEFNPGQKITAKALDLRCGAGIGLLSMLHPGVCEIENVLQIKRGYEGYDKQLNTLLGGDLFCYEQEEMIQ